MDIMAAILFKLAFMRTIYIWNDGEMPLNLDFTDRLFMKHSFKPDNPKLANVFFKSGMIEVWGRGVEKIRRFVDV